MAAFKIPLDPGAAKRAGISDPPHMLVDITCNVPETAVDAQLIAVRKALSGDGTKDLAPEDKTRVEAMPADVAAVIAALDAAKTGKG